MDRWSNRRVYTAIGFSTKFVTPRNILSSGWRRKRRRKCFQDRFLSYGTVKKREREKLYDFIGKIRTQRENYPTERERVVARMSLDGQLYIRHAVNWGGGRKKGKSGGEIRIEIITSSLEISSVINNYVNVSLSIAFATCPSV